MKNTTARLLAKKIVEAAPQMDGRIQADSARQVAGRSALHGSIVAPRLHRRYRSLLLNLQNGSKAYELDNAISELEDTINDIENVTGHDVEFPGMF